MIDILTSPPEDPTPRGDRPGGSPPAEHGTWSSNVETSCHRRQHASDPRRRSSSCPWLTEKTAGHQAFDTEIVDLRDWPLPFFGEHFGTIGDINDPTYSEPLVKAWNQKIKSADAFIIVTAEYNHSIPGGLKNAIDTVWLSFGFRNKPVAFVGYSGGHRGRHPRDRAPGPRLRRDRVGAGPQQRDHP